MKICPNAKDFWFLFSKWNFILIQSQFYFSAAVAKWYQLTQHYLRKIVENSLANAPFPVRRSEKNCQTAEEESYPVEIELENEGSNEDWAFT